MHSIESYGNTYQFVIFSLRSFSIRPWFILVRCTSNSHGGHFHIIFIDLIALLFNRWICGSTIVREMNQCIGLKWLRKKFETVLQTLRWLARWKPIMSRYVSHWTVKVILVVTLWPQKHQQIINNQSTALTDGQFFFKWLLEAWWKCMPANCTET